MSLSEPDRPHLPSPLNVVVVLEPSVTVPVAFFLRSALRLRLRRFLMTSSGSFANTAKWRVFTIKLLANFFVRELLHHCIYMLRCKFIYTSSNISTFHTNCHAKTIQSLPNFFLPFLSVTTSAAGGCSDSHTRR